jgi:hypothetical protein
MSVPGCKYRWVCDCACHTQNLGTDKGEREANNDTVTTEYLPIHDRMSACLFDHEIGLGFRYRESGLTRATGETSGRVC